jgi:hypothetical protein
MTTAAFLLGVAGGLLVAGVGALAWSVRDSRKGRRKV